MATNTVRKIKTIKTLQLSQLSQNRSEPSVCDFSESSNVAYSTGFSIFLGSEVLVGDLLGCACCMIE
jgi:hypothetical protein